MDLVRVGVDLRLIFFSLDLDQYIDDIGFVALSSGVVRIVYLDIDV